MSSSFGEKSFEKQAQTSINYHVYFNVKAELGGICWCAEEELFSYNGYNETNASADSNDPSGEFCMQPVTCCLSVSKPVKGELIIPAGWVAEACTRYTHRCLSFWWTP